MQGHSVCHPNSLKKLIISKTYQVAPQTLFTRHYKKITERGTALDLNNL